VFAHSTEEPDRALEAGCPPAVSIRRIDEMLQWSASTEGPGSYEFDQIIGRADSASEAIDVVALFAETASCDLSGSFGAGATTSGGEIEIEGAAAAASLVIEAIDGAFVGEMVVVAVDDIVMVAAIGIDGGDGDDLPFDDELADEIARLAVGKVRRLN
jgi:hypothetical protein